jgi:hypothetical protein
LLHSSMASLSSSSACAARSNNVRCVSVTSGYFSISCSRVCLTSLVALDISLVIVVLVAGGTFFDVAHGSPSSPPGCRPHRVGCMVTGGKPPPRLLFGEIGPQEVSVCQADAERKFVRLGISEPLLPARGQSLVPIVRRQQCNHTSDGPFNDQIIVGGLDTGQPHENVAIRTLHDHQIPA